MAFAILACAVVGLTSCGSKKTAYTEGYKSTADDNDVYANVLGEYEAMIEAAKAENDLDKKYALYAKAEAYLLDQAVMVPTTTNGGTYAITRIAPRTVPYVLWGIDSDKLGTMVVANELITAADRAEMMKLYNAAKAGGAEYDPAKYLTSNGYTLASEYSTTFTTTPQTLDLMDTSRQADSEIITNFASALVQYDNMSVMQPELATVDADGNLYTVSEDGKTYTFTIRDDANWYTAEGEVYAAITAQDFVSGFQHMLDSAAGLEFLVDGRIKGVSEYLAEETTDFSTVGIKAEGNKLSIELTDAFTYFPTMLTYNIFYPMNAAFFEAQGGAFGIQDFATAKTSEDYKYGINTDIKSILYSGQFICKELTDQSKITFVKNDGYFNADKVFLDEVTFIYDDGSNLIQLFNDTLAGNYTAIGLSTSLITEAKAKTLDGDDKNIFDTYSYVTDTDATTFFLGLNMNRKTFGLENGTVLTNQSIEEAKTTNAAMQIKDFRQALLYAFDRETWNGSIRGTDLAKTNLRNMYSAPDFLTTSTGETYGSLVQKELVKLDSSVIVDDGVEGWYNPTKAAELIQKVAKENPELFADGAIQIDMFYYAASTSQAAQASAFKKSIEESLTVDGKLYVEVNMITCDTTDDYYYSGYYCESGEEANYDVFYGSGWGPDFGDPISYLDTFLKDGYMIKTVGLF